MGDTTKAGYAARVEDPVFHLGDPYSVYERLRRSDPVHFRPEIGIWLVTRYRDVVTISKDSEHFTCTRGVFIGDATNEASAAAQYFAGSELISMVDPPRHNELRKVISPAFTPRRVAQLEDSIRETARRLVRALPTGETVDFIATVAEVLPLVVIARLLGTVGEDIRQMARWSDEMAKLGVQLSDEERRASIAVFAQMNDFMRKQFAIKRSQPAEDLLSTLLAAELDNTRLDEDNILMWASVVLAGGNETTRALIGNAVDCLARHPEQLSLLAAGQASYAGAVEETLRWAGPVNYFCRSVSADVELGGKTLRSDDWVCLLYASADRDEEIFTAADRFDITAPRTMDNVAFGVGQHYCPGNRLARTETRILLEELQARFPRWVVTRPGERIVSDFRRGFVDLPVVLYED
jgi:cytochrome P450